MTDQEIRAAAIVAASGVLAGFKTSNTSFVISVAKKFEEYIREGQ